jgi:hypothetical protein
MCSTMIRNGTRLCLFKCDKVIVRGSGGQVFESTR